MSRLEKLLRHFGIADFFGVKIDHRYMRTVFHFQLTQFVQMLFPVAELFQIFGDALGKENVPGIATIHHSLGDVDAGAGDVGSSAHIDDALTGPLCMPIRSLSSDALLPRG